MHVCKQCTQRRASPEALTAALSAGTVCVSNAAPAMSTPPTMNPYRVLKVPRTATIDEIKRAYKLLALKYHPDKQDRDASSERLELAAKKLEEANEARALIGTEDARAAFDVAWDAAHPASVDTQTNWDEEDDDADDTFWEGCLRGLLRRSRASSSSVAEPCAA